MHQLRHRNWAIGTSSAALGAASPPNPWRQGRQCVVTYASPPFSQEKPTFSTYTHMYILYTVYIHIYLIWYVCVYIYICTYTWYTYINIFINIIWLVASIPLKHISQFGLVFPIFGHIKNCSKPQTSMGMKQQVGIVIRSTTKLDLRQQKLD